MGSSGSNRRRSGGGRERLAHYSIKGQSEEEMECKFVLVPRELKSHVIGNGGCMLHEIMQTSGAQVSSQSAFAVSSDKEQKACATKLIEKKEHTVKSTMWEQVTISDKYNGLVMWTRIAELIFLAKVIYNNKDVYITCGTDQQRKPAQAFIGIAVVWVANTNLGRTFDDIPSDIKNPLGEVHLKATPTQCRGWLVLKSVKYLQGDILFPGCEFDCRFPVLGRTDILARGPSRLYAYKKALAYGETSAKRFQLILIGQDRAGKTSLKNSLQEICFDPVEDSTVGVDEDPHFKVSTETCRTGTINQDKNCNADISCYYHTALIIGKLSVDSVMDKRKGRKMQTDTDESRYSFDSKLNDVTREPRLSGSSKDTENIQTSRDPEPALRRHESHISEESQGDVNVSTTNVPEEVAVVEESLLRGDLDDNRDDISSTMWDFAGQSVSYHTHPLFLTSRAIHCLVYNLSQNRHDMAKPLVKQGVFKETQESKGKAVDCCQTHQVEQCKEVLTRSELYRCKEDIFCTRSVQNTRVQVMQFAPWFSTKRQQIAVGERDGKPFSSYEENEETAVALPDGVLKSLLPESCHSKQVVCQLKEILRLNTASLEQPDTRTKQLLCCLARTAKRSDRLDVVKHVREITPYGTTGPLLPERLDVRRIPFSQRRQLTIALSGRDEWMLVAEKLGLSPDEIRFLDKRTKNPAEAVLNEITHQRSLTVGELYAVLRDCGVPVIADKLFVFSQLAVDERDGKRVSSHEENGEKVVALPDGVLKSILSESCDSKQVVCQLEEGLRLDTASLEKPDIRTKQLIRCVARKANCSDRLNVVKHLREITPSGTTGSLLPESLDVRRIPFPQRRQLTIALSGGDEWMLVAEKLGLSPDEIRFFDKRTKNPAEAVLSEIAHQRTLTVGELYAVLWDCGVPVIADKLFVFSQLAVDERDGKRVSSHEENGEKVVALPDGVLKSLLYESCDSKQVVCQLEESLRQDTASLEQPDIRTKQLIRCVARKANCSDRLDVVKHLREITPSGTTGPLLPESLDVRRIPFSQRRQLTIALSGRDEWIFVAEKLGLSADLIRCLDECTLNPANAVLNEITHQRSLTVGELYAVLCDCGLPVIADKL